MAVEFNVANVILVQALAFLKLICSTRFNYSSRLGLARITTAIPPRIAAEASATLSVIGSYRMKAPPIAVMTGTLS